ncbi:MAG: hypothetical protein ABIH17_01325 [Pseudomonadota bacterium]
MSEPNRLLAAAEELQAFCTRAGWKFCFIGGIAVQHWGEARLTRDADLTVFTGVGDEPHYVDTLLAGFGSRMQGMRDFALRHRVLLLRASNGIPLDISLGALDFENKAAERSLAVEIADNVRLRLCSPEALIVFKVFAGRPQDWLDIEGVVAKSGARIDWDEVRADLRLLLELKHDTESAQRLEMILVRRGLGPA